MSLTTSAEQSLWLATAQPTAYSPLENRTDADVAVIGGGIAGLTAALLLAEEGNSVALLEAGRVGTGVTGCTTAKVTALQATVYSAVRKRHGAAAAATYAEASLAGVEKLAELAGAHAIDCDLERRPALTYAAQPDQRATVKEEAAAAREAGLPIDFEESADLPCPVYGAVRLADQVQVQPVRYAQGLAGAVTRAGSQVYEQSRALSIRGGSRWEVRTGNGAVHAEHVVVASHYPFLDRGGYFARMKAQRSYCLAARLGSGAAPRSMAISAGQPTRSIRDYQDLLIVGGEGHATGDRSATPERYEKLAEFARSYWDVTEISHRWSAQDPVHYDHLPVAGPYLPGASRLWVTSGFMKWGFASATFAAMIIADRISGRANPWAGTFSPSRITPRSLPEVAQLGAKFTLDLVGDRLRRPAHSVGDLPPGEARIVGDGAGRKGVYRDDRGGLHAVSVRCTHLGCLLRFNSAERSWDCPCHGSRFDVDGAVLEGPAVHPLQRRTP